MKIINMLVMVFTIGLMSGCAGNPEIIKGISQSTREDVFQKIPGKTSPVPGVADLLITASIKTHREDLFLFEKSSHGKPDFMILLNVDGQMITLKGEMKEEKGGYAGESDPEAGNGIRYGFSESIRLKPGSHSIAIAIPDDNVAISRKLQLKEGSNFLSIKPVYRNKQRNRRIGFVGDTSFYEGIKGLRLILNGNEV
jgi:hypothetical protein